MPFAMRLDEFGRPAWIAAVLVGFWLFWPLGVAVLAYLAWTGRLRDMTPYGGDGLRPVRFGRWNAGPGGFGFARRRGGRPSGNQAFDDYRDETLRRLEDEQREFAEYLERLRRARDKAEFDQFMAERRQAAPMPDQG
jgi:hypothetical protein